MLENMSSRGKNTYKICFLLPGWVTRNTGGAEWQCFLLSEELLANGWEVEVITQGEKLLVGQYEASEFYNPKITYHYWSRSKQSYLLNFWRLFLLLFKTNSDFYYNRTDARLMRGASALFCRLRRRKMIYAIAHDEELVKRRYYDLYRSRNILNPKNLIKKLDTFLTDRLINNSEHRADLVLAQTFFQQEKLLSNLSLKSVVLRNSISLPNAGSLPRKKDKLVIWVANMRVVKQPMVFVDLIRKLNRSDWQFIMIGNTLSFDTHLKKTEIPNLKVTGEISYEETLNYFAKASILVNTSEEEGFSNTFIQAWVYRVLLVSLAVDPDHLIADRGFGEFCDNNTDILLEKVRDHIDQFPSIPEQIQIAEEFAHKEFSLKENTRKFITLTEELHK